MKDYLSRESLIKTLRETPFTMSMCLSVDECNGMNRARSIFADIFEVLPAADVVERKSGKWIELPSACNGAILTQCSSCRRILSDTQLGMVKRFCPNCGADMREES